MKHVFVLINDWLDAPSPYIEPPRTKDYGEQMICANCEKSVKNKTEAEKLKDEKCFIT